MFPSGGVKFSPAKNGRGFTELALASGLGGVRALADFSGWARAPPTADRSFPPSPVRPRGREKTKRKISRA